MPNRVTIWAEAGGVGKTTFAASIAAALGRLGHNVLAVDLDHQAATLTEWAGYGQQTDTSDGLNILTCLLDSDHSFKDIIVDAGEYDLVPSHTDLAMFAQQSTSVSGSEFLLQGELDALGDEYDYILVDAPASRGPLSDNALIATGNLLVPMPLGHKGYTSVRGIEETVEAMEDGLRNVPGDNSLHILGIVPNRVEDKSIEDASREALEKEGSVVLPVEVRERGVLEEAWNAHMSIFEFADAEETRDLRPYEKDVTEQFLQLAKFISGEWVPMSPNTDNDAAEVEV